MFPDPTAEHRRLSDSAARRADWKNWGPYVAERAWGTVREDYSASGDAWNHFPHDQRAVERIAGMKTVLPGIAIAFKIFV